MRKGTILKNLWAGHETYFVYMGFPVRSGKAEAKKTGGYSLVNVDGVWRFEKAQYYIHSLKDQEHFPVVGHIDFNQTLIDGILNAIEKKRREPDGE